MSTEQQDVSSASAGGAPAPDFNAIRDAVIDSFRAVPLWQFRQGLVTAGLIPADVEITAADRKPVHSEPGVDADWDEDANAMLVHGVGWDLSWGCKVSFAYDHDKGEHYVCVSTSDADQRAGITTRRATKEQLASLGQQLLNVFGEPDPRDAEIKQLRTALARYQKRLGDDLLCGGKLVERVRAALRVDNGGTCTRASMDGVAGDVGRLCDEIERLRNTMQEIADLVAADATRPDSVCSAVENWLFELDQRRGERDEARMEWKRADAEVTRLRGELAKANTGWEVWRDEQRAHDKRRDNELRVVAERLHELIGDTEPCAMAFISTRHLHGLLDRVVAEPSPEIERLKLEVASARSIADEKRAVAKKLRGQVDELETQRDRRQTLWQTRYGHLIGGVLDVQQHLQRALGKPALPSDKFDPDYSRSMVDGLKAERDRLRQELDLVGEQQPKFQPGQRVRIGLCDGIVITPKDTTRVQFEGMLHTFDIPTRDVHAIDDIVPAEPRRWVAGDPEPKIGTTVWRRADKYTRSGNGWHHVDIHTGYASWAWILSVGSEIVEAIADPKDGA